MSHVSIKLTLETFYSLPNSETRPLRPPASRIMIITHSYHETERLILVRRPSPNAPSARAGAGRVVPSVHRRAVPVPVRESSVCRHDRALSVLAHRLDTDVAVTDHWRGRGGSQRWSHLRILGGGVVGHCRCRCDGYGSIDCDGRRRDRRTPWRWGGVRVRGVRVRNIRVWGVCVRGVRDRGVCVNSRGGAEALRANGRIARRRRRRCRWRGSVAEALRASGRVARRRRRRRGSVAEALRTGRLIRYSHRLVDWHGRGVR